MFYTPNIDFQIVTFACILACSESGENSKKKSKQNQIKITHFEFTSESVKLAELQLCLSESRHDTGLNDELKDTLYVLYP